MSRVHSLILWDVEPRATILGDTGNETQATSSSDLAPNWLFQNILGWVGALETHHNVTLLEGLGFRVSPTRKMPRIPKSETACHVLELRKPRCLGEVNLGTRIPLPFGLD